MAALKATKKIQAANSPNPHRFRVTRLQFVVLQIYFMVLGKLRKYVSNFFERFQSGLLIN